MLYKIVNGKIENIFGQEFGNAHMVTAVRMFRDRVGCTLQEAAEWGRSFSEDDTVNGGDLVTALFHLDLLYDRGWIDAHRYVTDSEYTRVFVWYYDRLYDKMVVDQGIVAMGKIWHQTEDESLSHQGHPCFWQKIREPAPPEKYFAKNYVQ